MRYAELNSENVVIAISDLHSKEKADNLILINDLEVELGSTFNRTTGEFTPPEPQPTPEPKTKVEEITEETLLETKYQTFLLEMMI